MSKKYHISKNGIPAVCHAQPGKCPIGGNDVHFDSVVKSSRICRLSKSFRSID